MNSKWVIAATFAFGSLVTTSSALAQDADKVNESRRDRLAAEANAVELTISTGYEQGFGDIASGQPSLTDVGQAGGAVQVGVGYRLIPQLTLGVYGSGGMFGRGSVVDGSTNLYTATAGVQADWHFLPAGSELDPWVSLGSGWRGYWQHADQGTTSLQGWEIAKLQVGADYRIDRAVAVGPLVGVDLSTFFTQSTPSSNGFNNVSSPSVNTFLFAGLQGRFDIPTSPSREVASR
jgi:hypothetical protein